ncbi:hypothetical protein DDZ14_01415 [Maritimibacter sp. 55A14]|uniref:tetratricopeptide repeat-containing sulfotransferase family protein n=1 Tax=Maritimibacter sp. 55A14 TaxID=2174844 RepID=UPI000D621221|nr:sulfotransferase [Maritimibacter sp. 55A14]PWE34391.1 hypothetical protein DDZ14_01415 [Maritimibacter sp. 55A14]
MAGPLPNVAQAVPRARRLAREGDPQAAFDLLAAVLERFPRNRKVLAELRALNAEPDAARAHYGLGEKLSAGAWHLAAIASLDEALRLAPGDARVLSRLGDVQRLAGRAEAALESHRRAAELAPERAAAQFGMGVALQDLGRMAEAAEAYRRALAADPDHAAAHMALGLVAPAQPGDSRLDRMEALAADPGRDATGRAMLHHALGKAHDDLGETAAAFDHFARAGALRKSALDYRIEADRALFDRAARLTAPPLAPRRRAAPCPIFIVGMPRSGTTLIEQVLACHRDVAGEGELELLSRSAGPLLRAAADPGFAGPDRTGLEVLREAYLAGLAQRGAGRAFVTDKMPQNFLLAGLIAAAFPEAPVIHLRRDARAVCWSVFRTWFASARAGFACDLADIAAYYRMYADLMARWHACLPGRIADLDYEAFTEDPEAGTRRLLAACGLDWDAACLAPHRSARAVSTASAAQVRRPVYRGSSQDWRRYEAHLGPLLEGLEGLV